MRKIICLFTACLCVFIASAQDFEAIALQQKIAKYNKQDKARVNMLNALAGNNSITPGKQDTVATEALSLSRKLNYARGESFALVHLSTSKYRQSNRPDAIRLWQVGDSMAKVAGDQDLLITVLLAKALLYSRGSDNQEALALAKQAESMALKIGHKKLLSLSQIRIGSMYGTSFNNFPEAIDYALKAVVSGEEADCLACLASAWAQLGASYTNVGDQNAALAYFKKARDANTKLGNTAGESNLNNAVGERYRLMGKYREAIPYYNSALALTRDPYNIALLESNLADVYTHLNDLPQAIRYASTSIATAREIEDNEGIAWVDAILSRIYLKKGMVDSALFYSQEGFQMARQTGTLEYIRDNASGLSNAYALKKDFENAYNYHRIYINYRDSMLNSEISNKSAVLQYNYDLAKKQSQIAALDQQRKVQKNWLVSTVIVLLLILITTILLLRNNRQKQKANLLLNKQKVEIGHQRDQTNKALTELQQMQQQLIQSEKMASLGELTAGIAHEIQNPLNFVNNFSEVNKEMIAEMKDAINKGDFEEVKFIAKTIEENQEKINHHGKRADGIVKGMLQHSRSSSGKKEATDINALADEYLRLAYHGLRAKDKSFNATLKTNYDDNIKNINIIPQDIGRVILNLITNAFYAVGEKKRSLDNVAGQSYEPTVSVSTKKMKDTVEITVSDNGNGIPQDVIDKIFQPFFTTKPTGQGTGLGLSLSYDIVKVHQGELKVNTSETNGTEFKIILPA